MTELELIQEAVMRAGQRRRMARALNGLWRGLLWGGVASLSIGGLYRLLPLPEGALYAAAIAPVLGGVLGFIAGGWRSGTLLEHARWVDKREKLQERLSTALEFAEKPAAGRWGQLILADAAEHAKGLDARRMITFSLGNAARWASLVLALAVGLGFVPEYRSKDYLRQVREKENVKQIGRQLTELTRRSLEKRAPLLEPTQKSLEAVVEAGQKLSGASLNRSQALQELASVTEKLKNELGNLNRDPALQRMQQAARSASSAAPPNAAALQQQMDALQKQLGTPTGSPDAMEKVRKALEQLRQQAAAQAQNSSGPTAEQKEQMSAALSALSRQMDEMGLQAPMIEAAMQALADNNTELFLKHMDTALADLEKTRDMAKALQQLQQQMSELGKDLAEQLKRGQPEAAHMTMQKMTEQLRSGELSPEKMQAMLNDLTKAVDPAGNYGDVAKHLKAAAAQMQKSDKQGAAASLAEASKELDSLMQQLGDAEALAAELETLKDATLYIANGQAWGQGNRGNKPGQGKGKTGSGVGTWADDEAGPWQGEITERWDNSGFERDEMDPRGLTDRGAATLNDSLQPTKVRGQFSPGSQMPSMTLKGVSIRGQSSVQYQEASAAAQSDAQSALSQEKVPRAYQGAVKDYFDDIKK